MYNPVPSRVWSRVDNGCTFANTTNTTNSNEPVYEPLLRRSVKPGELAAALQMLNKGNILQYKKNSSNLTKNQRYAQIAKGMWTNRTNTWSAQNINTGFTDSNTNSLQRVGATTIYLATGLPAPPPATCPFDYDTTPYDQIVILNGGTLLCNTVEDPCTGDVVVQSPRSSCNPTTNSNVPGPIQSLCWNDGIQTWYPRQRYFMNSSGGNKFPQGYKVLVRAN